MLGFTLLCLLSATVFADDSTLYKFNIESQGLIKSLNELSNQTESLILFSYDLVEERNAPAVKGHYTVEQALNLILANTGLVGGRSHKGVLTISMSKSDVPQNYLEESKMNKKKGLWALFAALTSASVSTHSVAQDDNKKIVQTTLEEIVVTARKRSETLQDVPVAVTAFTESTIKAAGIEKPADYIGLTPNVSISDAQDAGNVAIVVRGIGQIRNGEAPVAIVVDGVLQSTPFQLNQPLNDIQQIEVLKGPQGALYGRNAIAGAVNITTKQPGDKFEGKVIVGTGNGGQARYGVTLSSPITDNLAVRGSFNHREADGWINNTFLNRKVDFFDEDSGNIRFVYTPNDNFTADLRASYSDLEGGATYFALASNANRDGVVAPDVVNDVVAPITNKLGFNKREIEEFSLKLDYESEVGTFTSITSKTDLDLSITYDGPDYSDNAFCFDDRGVAAPPCTNFGGTLVTPGPTYFGGNFRTALQNYEISNTSQEFRFTSPDDRRLRYIVGAYFLDRERNLSTVSNVDGQPNEIFATDVIDLVGATPNPTRSIFAEENENTAYAIFAQVNYDITDDLELSVALRYDEEEREQTDPRPDAVRSQGFTDLSIGFLDPVDPSVPRVRKETFSETQPKVTLSYDVSDNVSVYGTYARGFRSGGFNAPGTANDVTIFSVFGEEVSDNIEAGFKSTLLDGALTLNGAIFSSQIDDLQVFDFDLLLNAQVITIIDEADILGGELELAWKTPVDGLDISAGFGYSDTEIKKSSINPAAVGNQIPFNTKSSFNLGIQYRTTFSDTTEGFIRLDWERKGKTYFHQGGTASGVPVRDALDLFNLRLGVDINNTWSIALWGRNLSDEEYYEEVIVPDFSFQARPRSAGIDVTYEF